MMLLSEWIQSAREVGHRSDIEISDALSTQYAGRWIKRLSITQADNCQWIDWMLVSKVQLGRAFPDETLYAYTLYVYYTSWIEEWPKGLINHSGLRYGRTTSSPQQLLVVHDFQEMPEVINDEVQIAWLNMIVS